VEFDLFEHVAAEEGERTGAGFALDGVEGGVEDDAIEVDAEAVEGGGAEGDLGGEVVVGGDAGKALDGAEGVIGEDAGEVAKLASGEVDGGSGFGAEGAGGDVDGVGTAEGIGDEADLQFGGFGG
jgi:hypothetical protein